MPLNINLKPKEPPTAAEILADLKLKEYQKALAEEGKTATPELINLVYGGLGLKSPILPDVIPGGDWRAAAMTNPEAVPSSSPPPPRPTFGELSRLLSMGELLKKGQTTLTPGQTLFGPSGKTIANLPPPLLTTSPGTGVRNPKTGMLIDTQPFAPKEANWKTYYDSKGNPHTIDVTKENPKSDWGSAQPASSEAVLTAKALAGDRGAQATLNAMEDRANRMASVQGEQRAKQWASTRGMAVIDPEDETKTTALVMPWSKINEYADKGVKLEAASRTPENVQAVAEARVPGSARAASVRTAARVYDIESKGLIDLRNKVAAKGLLPDSRFKDLNAIKQWIGVRTSDPDTAVLKKKTKLLADTLQRTLGGAQGGEWAFLVAADILDPSFDATTFQAILEAHGQTLNEYAEAYKNFGREPTININTANYPKPMTREDYDKLPSGTEYIDPKDGTLRKKR